ncbi:MAG TPA: hypothetical protein VG841_16015 [Caulobacterales bacterium]|nr:hypothetical protein [Caulobacterales bacterium]
MKLSMGLALGLGMLGLASCATSPDPRRDRNAPPPLHALISADALVFATFDTDGDLKVSGAELEAGITREFARADVNHDGALQPIEFQNWSNAALGGANLPPYRLDFDRNVDNTITAEEFHDELAARAHSYDADEDGVLTRAEFIRTINQTRPAMHERREDMRRGGGRRPPGG